MLPSSPRASPTAQAAVLPCLALQLPCSRACLLDEWMVGVRGQQLVATWGQPARWGWGWGSHSRTSSTEKERSRFFPACYTDHKYAHVMCTAAVGPCPVTGGWGGGPRVWGSGGTQHMLGPFLVLPCLGPGWEQRTCGVVWCGPIRPMMIQRARGANATHAGVGTGGRGAAPGSARAHARAMTRIALPCPMQLQKSLGS